MAINTEIRCPDCGGWIMEEPDGSRWCEFVEFCGWGMSINELKSPKSNNRKVKTPKINV